jgi:pimeloyl-ACP methyl ester carboxylesterase
VIAPDRPGYGYSDRPRGTKWIPERQARLLLAFMDRLGIESPVVVGHSWGAMVALAMALEARAVSMPWRFCPATISPRLASTSPCCPVRPCRWSAT